MVHGNLINSQRNSDIFKPVATDEITILTYYSKEFRRLDKKLIFPRLTSQSNGFCNLEAMVQGGEGLKDLKYWGLRRWMEITNQVTKSCSSNSSTPLPLSPPTCCGLLAHHLFLMQCSVWQSLSQDSLALDFEHFSWEPPPSGEPSGSPKRKAGRGHQNTEGCEALDWSLKLWEIQLLHLYNGIQKHIISLKVKSSKWWSSVSFWLQKPCL